MTTIAAQIMFPLFIMYMPRNWFGGAIGLNLDPAFLGPITFNTDTSLYYLIMITAIIMIFLAFNLVRGRLGRAFVAIRDTYAKSGKPEELLKKYGLTTEDIELALRSTLARKQA